MCAPCLYKDRVAPSLLTYPNPAPRQMAFFRYALNKEPALMGSAILATAGLMLPVLFPPDAREGFRFTMDSLVSRTPQ